MIWRRWHAFPLRAELCALALIGLTARPVAGADLPASREPEACRVVRLADVGWTDVTATTATLSQVLKRLRYEPRTTLLSVPVTFAAMRRRDIDVFLGNWMPAQTHDRAPYLEDHSVEIVRANLSGAKYTLAVPAYTYAAGLHDFADIPRFATVLDHAIYGIESGNDGNRHVLEMIQRNDHGLGSFHLVESSEQGMLAQVARAFQAHAPIVFLAWDPHPMNMQFDLRYLTGGDSSFGPNYGGATVFTLVRTGYLAQCPNVARLLSNLEFTTRGESEVMQAILVRHETPEAAAASWLARHPQILASWLEGVRRADGRALSSIDRIASRNLNGRIDDWVVAHKIPVGVAVTDGIDWAKHHGAIVFGAIAALVTGAVALVYGLLQLVPAALLVIALAVLAWLPQRSWSVAAFVAAALLLIMNLGYWQPMLETLALVTVATFLATIVGVPLGIAAGHRPALAATLRPALDLMQTLPTFVYLIPTLVLFGLGVVPALISTVIFALPAPIRLTQLGIAGVPRPLIDAGEAFGATPWQRLYKIELPSAAPLIFAGITQCIMLSLSMVVIAALVGAGGLGVPVVRALNTVQVGMGLEAGIVIVLLAIIMDRITRALSGRQRPGMGGPPE